MLSHAGLVIEAGAMKGAPRDTLGEEVRRGYVHGRIRALVYSCGSGDIVVEASSIPKEGRVLRMSHSKSRALWRASMCVLVM